MRLMRRQTLVQSSGCGYDQGRLAYGARRSDAYKVRLRVAPPDLSAPPIAVLARRFQGGARSAAFNISHEYQKLFREYARNGVVVFSIHVAPPLLVACRFQLSHHFYIALCRTCTERGRFPSKQPIPPFLHQLHKYILYEVGPGVRYIQTPRFL